MAQYFFKISLFFVLIIGMTACGPKSSRKKGGKNVERAPKAEMPTKGTKFAFIFPAGAGAMRVSLGILAQMEKDLGRPIHTRIDMAGGVSSGALVAASVTSGNPPQSPDSLRNEMSKLMEKVFPDTIKLVNLLIKDYRFTYAELEVMFKQFLVSRPDTSTPAKAGDSIVDIMKGAVLVKPTIGLKIADITKLTTDMAPIVLQMAGFAPQRAILLKDTIDMMIGSSVLSDPKNAKLIAISSSQKKAVFFSAPAVAKFLPGPVGEGATDLGKALVASAAIPGFIQAPTDITFHEPSGGGNRIIADLEDGFFAENVKFDPTAPLYDVFTKQFAGQDLVMIYVGNGSEINDSFRKNLRGRNDIYQSEMNGKKITLVDIRARIEDSKGDNIFNLSGFYDSLDMAKYLDDAAKKAVQKNAYKWAVEALRATR